MPGTTDASRLGPESISFNQRKMMRSIGLVAVLCACSLCPALASDRLVERPLNLLSTGPQSSNNYTPRHLAGYFKVGEEVFLEERLRHAGLRVGLDLACMHTKQLEAPQK